MAVVHLTEENFEKEVLKSKIPVLVDFWAPWCTHCIAIAPAIDELEKEMGKRVKFGKLNVAEGRPVAVGYNVMSIPALILFRDGKELSRKGPCSKNEIRNWIEEKLRETPEEFREIPSTF